MSKPKNPFVFLDISIGKEPAGRLEIELFANDVPITAENFRALCTGECGNGKVTHAPLNLKGTKFHCVHPHGYCIGGDIMKKNDHEFYDGESIYGGVFDDENYDLLHSGPGILSMCSSRDRNGSIFSITFKRLPELDGSRVVFGKVIGGMETLKKIEEMVVSPSGKPKIPIKITSCGQLSQDEINKLTDSVNGENEKSGKRDISDDTIVTHIRKKQMKSSPSKSSRSHNSSEQESGTTL